jgi:hypothetical protein
MSYRAAVPYAGHRKRLSVSTCKLSKSESIRTYRRRQVSHRAAD